MVREQDFHQAVIAYYQQKHPSCSLGQYLMSTLVPSEVDMEILSEEDDHTAYTLFYERYVSGP